MAIAFKDKLSTMWWPSGYTVPEFLRDPRGFFPMVPHDKGRLIWRHKSINYEPSVRALDGVNISH